MAADHSQWRPGEEAPPLVARVLAAFTEFARHFDLQLNPEDWWDLEFALVHLAVPDGDTETVRATTRAFIADNLERSLAPIAEPYRFELRPIHLRTSRDNLCGSKRARDPDPCLPLDHMCPDCIEIAARSNAT